MSSVYWLARAGCALAKWTPRSMRHGTGSIAGALSYASWREKRLVTQHNMAQISGLPVDHPHVRRLALASWYNYGRYAADFLYFPQVDSEQLQREAVDLSQGVSSWVDFAVAAFKPGRGAILTSAHFGNWDFAGAIFTSRFPLSAVAETFSDARLNTLLQSQRIAKGIGILPMEGSARRILRVLQQNQFVAIVADRPVSADEGVPTTFFGRRTYVPAGPAALALKTGAALLPGFVWYGSRQRLYLRAFPPIFPEEAKGKSKDDAIAYLTQRTYDALEEVVREWPTQWYMFRPFWPEQSEINK